MSEEPSLPRLPAVSWDERSQSFSNNPRKRVRGRNTRNGQFSAANSSDPAVFSSDDDPGLDNYVAGRQKRRYVGSWFQQQPASSDSAFGEEPNELGNTQAKQKRTLARQVDSGVFLGSDGTDGDDFINNLDIAAEPRLKLNPPFREEVVAISEAELAVRGKIQQCLEQGEETFDFYQMDLKELSNDTICELSKFSCIPFVAKDVEFEQKDPELRVFLANNLLKKLPGALFDVNHITSLSLRGNKLEELPPAIVKLQNLVDLNVGQNQLRYLPAEFLELIQPGGRLKHLVIHPNPFVRPSRSLGEDIQDDSKSSSRSSRYAYTGDSKKQPVPNFFSRHLGRSPVQISNSSGRILSEFKLSSSDTSGTLEVEIPVSESDTVPASHSFSQGYANISRSQFRSSATPSLVEVALRSCYRSAQSQSLSFYLPEDLDHLDGLLRRMEEQKQAGGLTCSRCRKLIVIPPGEWVEWRDLGHLHWYNSEILIATLLSTVEEDLAVPFLHRACSDKCGPREAKGELPRGYTHQLDDTELA